MPTKLAIFDVDGTLLREDTACLWIARKLGRYERMLELEEVSNRAELLAARREMVGWYEGSTAADLMGDLEEFPWAPGVFEGVQRLHDAGVTVALASVGWDFVVERVGRELGISRTMATTLDFATGSVGHVFGADKPVFAARSSEELGVSVSEIAGVGDSNGDVGLLDYCGLGIFVGSDSPVGKGYVHLPGADIRRVADVILGG